MTHPTQVQTQYLWYMMALHALIYLQVQDDEL